MNEGEPQSSAEWQRTHPLAVVASGLVALKNSLFPVIAVIFGTQIEFEGSQIAGYMAIPLILLIIGINLFAAWLGWIRLRYRVGESDVRVEQGIFSRRARSVPYERIQDVSLEQGPIPRLLGLTEVRFETGAGGKDELRLAYVAREEGERLREVVRDLRDDAVEGAKEGEKDEPIGDRPAPARVEEGEPLFAMGPGRLLVFGLFEFSLVVIAVIGGAAQQFDLFLPFGIWDFEAWEERLAGPGQWLAGLGAISRVIGALIAILVLLALGVVTGIVRTTLRDWDFRLDRTSKGFRRRRGLLTKTDVVMPVHRVQASVIDTGIVRRLWGWHGLSFISLAQDAKSANHAVAPFALMEEIAPILREAGFALPDADTAWRRPHPDYYLYRALVPLVPLAIAGLVLVAIAPGPWIGLGLLAGIVLIATRQHFLWRHERYAIDTRQILSRRGWLSPKVQVADRAKLHSVEITQGPLGRWCGYADLNFGLAGGTSSFNGLRLEDALQMRGAALSSMTAADFSDLPR